MSTADWSKEQVTLPWAPLVRASVRYHAGWERLIRALHGAGVCLELSPQSLRVRLGARIENEPDEASVGALLDDYYRGDGFPMAATRRSRQDRYVVFREDDGATAMQIVARIRFAAPELGALGLVEEQGAIVMRAGSLRVPLPPESLHEHGLPSAGGVVVRRTIAVSALVAAANQLLAQRGVPFRFVPVTGDDGVEAYLGVTHERAEILDGVDVIDGALEDLDAFACWRLPVVDSAESVRDVA